MTIAKSQAELIADGLISAIRFTWTFLVRFTLYSFAFGTAQVLGVLLALDPEGTTFKDFLLFIQSPALWFTSLTLGVLASAGRTLYLHQKEEVIELSKG